MQTLKKSIKWKNRNLPPQPPQSFHPKVNHCFMLFYPTRKKCMYIYSFIYPNELHYAHFCYRHFLLYISWYYFHISTSWWPHSFCSYKQCFSEYLCTHSEHLCTPILVLHVFCYSQCSKNKLLQAVYPSCVVGEEQSSFLGEKDSIQRTVNTSTCSLLNIRLLSLHLDPPSVPPLLHSQEDTRFLWHEWNVCRRGKISKRWRDMYGTVGKTAR